jgi:hypothetical protein
VEQGVVKAGLMNIRLLKLVIILCALLFAADASAWHDKTHLSICRAAGLDMWYHCAGPDLAKIKAGNVESYNHWFNNNAEVEITPQLVLSQVGRYNRTLFEAEGHLYGAIIASLRDYKKTRQSGKYALYHLIYCAHYISDLSMPLHNIAYDDFNKERHQVNDGIVEETIFDEPENITKNMYPVKLSKDNFENDLACEIARIANLTRNLGYKMRAGKRDMTRQEAHVQLGHSASLLRAVLLHYGKIPPSSKETSE